ncbi:MULTISPECIES: sugar ABC transporter permease [unclassified Paenibacillus]|uniref:carbohydrate ABC transporter permease n=1 Tax=unclassified Paenibacillus TaxID=185978 RepID=UPI002404F19B|nr:MULTISPECIES: sugar ABC transporter permease [unclassified Paenibacillus]MDF9843385.1 multiple sugar transport system permease protein [Paenibacillus sp. PastF-2]MDF9849973.1 multiple sugar transport system permease protein [Paenibacillus sp. PastM-2]MDF9856681.1 multiple sugar transport system permease protein [Paenibacillus sp. PastF-1]MDH6481951.1 multiple sugar transport system permease protein [Paenibacillus sp. PastH-2]MDH6509376.1 multiple sugar transport system permease protein [Pae
MSDYPNKHAGGINNKIKQSWLRSLADSDLTLGWMFCLPFLILWAWWFLYPFIQSFTRSFTDANFTALGDAQFIGVQNYVKILNDKEFFRAVLHSLEIVLISVPAQTVLGLLIAMLVNQKIKGKGLFRTVFFIPYITSQIAITTVFMMLFKKGTFVTEFFGLFGFGNVTWFADTHYALLFVCILFIFQQCGFTMIVYLSALQEVPKDLYEAGDIDGASKWAKFRFITVPFVRPITFFIVSVSTIGGFQIYDQIAAISRYGALGSPAGATSTVVTYFYQHGIRYMNIGYGSAAVVLFFFIIMFITFLQKKLLDEKG